MIVSFLWFPTDSKNLSHTIHVPVYIIYVWLIFNDFYGKIGSEIYVPVPWISLGFFAIVQAQKLEEFIVRYQATWVNRSSKFFRPKTA